MGKHTGFKEYRRQPMKKDPVADRVKHYKEFEHPFSDDEAKIQGARCMDCGIPFCHSETGCPVDNLIPEFNDLVYRGLWKEASENLHSTNNFPEFTGRLCPAPCESACVLGINEPAVTIKAIERTIADKAWDEGWVHPQPPEKLTGKTVAVVGSGPAGLAAAQQLARAGHSVTVYEREDRLGGLLRYGIPDFKMERRLIDRRIEQMREEGVVFRTNVNVGVTIPAKMLVEEYDAVILAVGSEAPRPLKVPGADLNGVHFAMKYLIGQNRVNAGDHVEDYINAKDKNVIVIGGGDTGSDCIGTANRQGAKAVYQLDYNFEPPVERDPETPWPLWPHIYTTSSSQEEGVERKWQYHTKELVGDKNGNLVALRGNKVIKHSRANIEDIPGTEFEIKADLVFIALGYTHPIHEGLVEELVKEGMKLDGRGNIKAEFGITDGAFETNLPGVYTCGDARRGQSLIVWAISEGRKCAAEVHKDLMSRQPVQRAI